VIRWLARRRFSFIDGLGIAWVALSIRDENWLAVAVVAVVMPVISIVTERAAAKATGEAP
jgi:hypothetical protein